MKILSPEAMRIRLGEMDVQDIRDLLGSALDTVSPILSQMIASPLEKVTGQKDIFLLDPRKQTRDRRKSVLALSRGFLTDDSVTITIANTYAYLMEGGEENQTPYYVEREKGLVTLMHELSTPYYVQVEYNAGFEETNDSKGVPVLVGCPYWLTEAAFIYGTSLYRELISNKDRSEERVNQQIKTDAPTAVMQLIAGRVRWFPTAFDSIV